MGPPSWRAPDRLRGGPDASGGAGRDAARIRALTGQVKVKTLKTVEWTLRRRDRKRRNQRIAAGVVGITILVAVLSIVSSGGAFDWSTPAVPGGSETGPTQSSTSEGVTLLLEPRSDGRCCLVTSVNPGDSSTRVLCFVVVFDETDRLLSTHLVPPKPAGHRRSSGFEISPGRQGHGFQGIPLDLSNQHYVSTCRPASWHGGAPI
jgi:hypothetical protein